MENKFTRFTVEQPDIKVVWEVPTDEVTGEDCMNAINTLMQGMSFLPITIIRSMQNYIDEQSSVLNNEQN